MFISAREEVKIPHIPMAKTRRKVLLKVSVKLMQEIIKGSFRPKMPVLVVLDYHVLYGDRAKSVL